MTDYTYRRAPLVPPKRPEGAAPDSAVPAPDPQPRTLPDWEAKDAEWRAYRERERQLRIDRLEARTEARRRGGLASAAKRRAKASPSVSGGTGPGEGEGSDGETL